MTDSSRETFELRPRGLRPLGPRALLGLAAWIVPGLVMAADGSQLVIHDWQATLHDYSNKPGAIPILVPWLLVVLARQAWLLAAFRAHRYVLEPDRLVVRGGVLSEKDLLLVPRDAVYRLDVRGADPVLRHSRGALVLEGVGHEGFEALRRVWPTVPVGGEPAPERDQRRRWLVVAVVVFGLAVFAEAAGAWTRSARERFDGLFGQVMGAANAAVAVVESEITARATADGLDPHFSPVGGGHWESAGLIDFGPSVKQQDLILSLATRPLAKSKGEPVRPRDHSPEIDVSFTITLPWGVFRSPSAVDIQPWANLPENERFVGLFRKELEARAIEYVVEPVRDRPR